MELDRGKNLSCIEVYDIGNPRILELGQNDSRIWNSFLNEEHFFNRIFLLRDFMPLGPKEML